MNNPTFNSDGYPTEETLQTISEWDDLSDEGYLMWVQFIKKAWHWEELVIVGESENLMVREASKTLKCDKYVLGISTGGWSGNESIISAMQDNILWMVNFLNHRVGGHYEFKLPKGFHRLTSYVLRG